MLAVDGLSRAFGGLKAVNDVSFEVAAGAITALIGPNGAGKSTVFNLVSGALRPDAGTVRFDGEDVTGLKPHALAARGVSRSFQITNLFGGFTVRETLRLGCLSSGPRGALFARLGADDAVEARVQAMLERYMLAPQADAEVRALSHGDQRRLEIALCMSRGPKLLMLDEPTQGMGPTETAETEALIAGLRGSVTVLLVEHDVDLVLGISDRVVVLQQGRKIADAPPDEIRSDPLVQDAYLGGVE